MIGVEYLTGPVGLRLGSVLIRFKEINNWIFLQQLNFRLRFIPVTQERLSSNHKELERHVKETLTPGQQNIMGIILMLLNTSNFEEI